MAQSLSDQRETGGVTQRQVIAAARAFAPFWENRARMLSETLEFARAEGTLLLIFERCAKDRILSGYVRHNVSKAAWNALKERYEEWERQERLEVQA